MTGDAPVTDKATPRPPLQIWRDAIDEAFSAIGTESLTDAEAIPMIDALTFGLEIRGFAVVAVNSYDESRACLEWALADIEGRALYETPEQREACIDRIRAHLEEGK